MSAPDLLFALGFVALELGIGLQSIEVALVVGGALLMFFALFAAMRNAQASAAPTGRGGTDKGGTA